tara:strand:+ start:182 stop:385 length:204 start_codon:yes stop_codon:yes gene_type:complete
MSDYNNKKKYKKKKAKERARKAKQAKRSIATKAENRLEKQIEKIKWENRSRLTPLRKVSEEKEENDA